LSLEEAAPHRITGAAKANGDECEHFSQLNPWRRSAEIAERGPGSGIAMRWTPANNAVRAALKAGITPSRIARQFAISQANVRKALASDEPRR
jgi:hypothetical protein